MSNQEKLQTKEGEMSNLAMLSVKEEERQEETTTLQQPLVITRQQNQQKGTALQQSPSKRKRFNALTLHSRENVSRDLKKKRKRLKRI